jgi:hypothetical protein
MRLEQSGLGLVRLIENSQLGLFNRSVEGSHACESRGSLERGASIGTIGLLFL